MKKYKKYQEQFFNEPVDLPEFFYRNPHLAKKAYRQMIEWAIKEYNDALRLFAKRKAWKTVRFYSNEVSPMRVLASLPDFFHLMSFMTDETWKCLSREDRRFLQYSYEIYNFLQ